MREQLDRRWVMPGNKFIQGMLMNITAMETIKEAVMKGNSFRATLDFNAEANLFEMKVFTQDLMDSTDADDNSQGSEMLRDHPDHQEENSTDAADYFR